MADEPKPAAGLDKKEIMNLLDFSALEDATGLKGMGMLEAAKAYDLKLDYLARQINCIFEFTANLNTRHFGDDDREKGTRGTIQVIKKNFPKGRAHYQQEIIQAEKSAEAYALKQKEQMKAITAEAFAKAKEITAKVESLPIPPTPPV